MSKNLIDLQLIAQNLLTDNPQINNHFDKTNEPLLIIGSKLSKKYPDLVPLNDNCLIKYIKSDNGIIAIIPFIANYDGVISLFNANNQQIEDYKIISYKFTESLASVLVAIGETELTVSARISKTGKANIAKNDGVLEGKEINIDYLEEKLIFIPIKDLPKNDYKLSHNHKKKTKKYGDLLIDLEDIKTGEIFRYVAINKEIEKLISKYENDTKFSIIEHQNFTNKDGVEAIKTIIKDLNFKDDLSDIELF